jgi:UDP-N-acetylglucosamine 2-epimerase (non-hydrolysing)
VDAGTARLVGTDEERIYQEARTLLSDPTAYAAMANAVSPYGDGRASQRIRYILLRSLGIESEQVPMWM